MHIKIVNNFCQRFWSVFDVHGLSVFAMARCAPCIKGFRAFPEAYPVYPGRSFVNKMIE
jgi:hypothetical protein